MKTVNVNVKGSKITFNLPTNLGEITEDYLRSITEGIDVAEHHSLICLVRHDKLNKLLLAFKKKSVETSVLPIFIKAGTTDNKFINSIKIKDKLIIPSTELNLAYHAVSVYNELDIDKVISTLSNNLTLEQRNEINMEDENKEVYFIEFKVIGNSSIKGAYKSTTAPEHTFINIEDLKSE